MDAQTDEMQGIEIQDVMNISADGDDVIPLPMSDTERQILELYDQLEEILLEVHLLQEAQKYPENAPAEVVLDKDIQEAQDGLLEAKAQYALRNTIIESILMSNPTLKAAHAGTNASPIERELLPMIEERDALSLSLTQTSSKILSLEEKLTRVQVEHVMAAKRNAGLAGTMLNLAAEASTRKREDIRDPAVRKQLDELEESLKVSRQRWRIMKGTASSVVTGSGLDWARDLTLRELVLDDESDED